MKNIMNLTMVGILSSQFALAAGNVAAKNKKTVAPSVTHKLDLSTPPDSLSKTGQRIQYRESVTDSEIPRTGLMTLTAIYEKALENDSRLESARSDLLAAQTHYSADFYRAFVPQIAITSGLVYGYDSFSPNLINSNGSYWAKSAGLNLAIPVFNFSQIIEANQSEFAISIAELKNGVAQQDLIQRVAKAYLEVLKIESTIKIKQDEIDGTRNHLEVITQQFNVGLASKVDLEDAKSKVAVAEAQKMDLEALLVTAKGEISQTWGLDVGEFKKLKENVQFPRPNPADPQKWIDQATTLNLNVQLNKGLVELSKYDIQKIKSALYIPSLNGAAGCNLQNSANSVFGNDFSMNSCSVGLHLNLALYDGGYTPTKAKEFAAIREKLRNDFRTSQIQSAQSARTSYAAILKNIDNIVYYAASVKSAAEALKGKKQQYLNSQRSSYEILLSLQTLNIMRQQLINEKFDFINNKLALKQAVGLLSVVDLEDIDKMLN